jgi:hypothetical protein
LAAAFAGAGFLAEGFFAAAAMAMVVSSFV